MVAAAPPSARGFVTRSRPPTTVQPHPAGSRTQNGDGRAGPASGEQMADPEQRRCHAEHLEEVERREADERVPTWAQMGDERE